MIVFDALTYAGKPDTGLAPLVLTDRRMYGRNADGSIDLRRGDETLTRQLAREVAAAGAPLCLDIEHLKLDCRRASDAEIEAGIDHLAEIIGWIRDERPGVRLGLYGILPLTEYWAQDAGWRAANARLRRGRDEATGRYIAEGLADLVDFLAPSLYTFYDDLPGWERFAIGMAREANPLQKPKYGFMHGRWHPNAKPEALRGQLIPTPFYKRQCEVAAEHFDGVVLWDGWDTMNNRTLPWDTDAAVRVEIARRAARVAVGGATAEIDKGAKA